ncbi:alpha/beta-hydrolase [Pholiota molesta]|nr:alpha/beta-hydrolase [Pholiota molesta]
MSGYIDVGANMSMWFWFFESRTAPEVAPFTLWLNGGPGCSSMIGLFQENGPCHVNPDGATTVLNPFSDIHDQPIGTGFSFGTDTVNSTLSAAPFVWQAFQILFESPQFAKFQKENSSSPRRVTADIMGLPLAQTPRREVSVSALMINKIWTTQSDEVIAQLNQAFLDQEDAKSRRKHVSLRALARNEHDLWKCRQLLRIYNVFSPAVGDRDSDDLRQISSALFPPEFYLNFLRSASVKALIGANSTYRECANAPFNLFTRPVRCKDVAAATWCIGEFRSEMLIWAGDADINCNWLGGHASVLAMDWFGKERLAKTPFKNMTINGEAVAAIQNVDNFSFARVYQAGHEVPAFRPQAAFEIFQQVVLGEQLHSVIVRNP